MKTMNRHRTSVVVALALATLPLALAPSRALAQANPNPPEVMTYQGFLVDGNGGGPGQSGAPELRRDLQDLQPRIRQCHGQPPLG
ncbi:MAG: hypothetical protein M5U12_33375 [Verrucomicrobia bacterium]|nr:hypothetical protein [Verrucomicrobiota bacterium]